jgi:hypothetical protein
MPKGTILKEKWLMGAVIINQAFDLRVGAQKNKLRHR